MYCLLTNLSSMDLHGDLIRQMFLTRKKVFVDDLDWPLRHRFGLEWDQFDNLWSHYLIVYNELHEVVAGVRFTPTAVKNAVYDMPMPYMICEAQEGKLREIPHDLLYEEAPHDIEIWEASRLFVTSQWHGEKTMAHNFLARGIQSASRTLGFTKLLAIADQSLSTKIGMMGFPYKFIGRDFECSGRGMYNVVEIEMG